MNVLVAVRTIASPNGCSEPTSTAAVLPETGLAISDMLTQILGVGVGDFVEVDLLEGQHSTVSRPVATRVERALSASEG